jgi:hypothetical protein
MCGHLEARAGPKGLPTCFLKLSERPFADICVALHGGPNADTHGAAITRKARVFDRQASRRHGKRAEAGKWRSPTGPKEVFDMKIVNFASDLGRQFRRVE